MGTRYRGPRTHNVVKPGTLTELWRKLEAWTWQILRSEGDVGLEESYRLGFFFETLPPSDQCVLKLDPCYTTSLDR